MFGATENLIIKVEGMHCAHCQAKVEAALKAVKGVKKATVDLEAKTAAVTVKAGKVTVDALKNAVSDAGFEVVE